MIFKIRPRTETNTRTGRPACGEHRALGREPHTRQYIRKTSADPLRVFQFGQYDRGSTIHAPNPKQSDTPRDAVALHARLALQQAGLHLAGALTRPHPFHNPPQQPHGTHCEPPLALPHWRRRWQAQLGHTATRNGPAGCTCRVAESATALPLAHQTRGQHLTPTARPQQARSSWL